MPERSAAFFKGRRLAGVENEARMEPGGTPARAKRENMSPALDRDRLIEALEALDEELRRQERRTHIYLLGRRVRTTE